MSNSLVFFRPDLFLFFFSLCFSVAQYGAVDTGLRDSLVNSFGERSVGRFGCLQTGAWGHVAALAERPRVPYCQGAIARPTGTANFFFVFFGLET